MRMRGLDENPVKYLIGFTGLAFIGGQMVYHGMMAGIIVLVFGLGFLAYSIFYLINK